MRESDREFLLRQADFIESYGRDEGGFSAETRASIQADADRLREYVAKRFLSPKPAEEPAYSVGTRVIVETPHDGPRHGVVAHRARKAHLVSVRLDGLKTPALYHVTFVRPEVPANA